MRTAGVTAALLFVVCLTAPGAQFRSGVQTVSVYATVRDASGRLATNLTRDEFRVFDNGRPVDIGVFSNDIQPLTVAVMLDMSGSMVPRFIRVRTATLHFIDALLPHDRAAIGSFGAEVFVSPMLTGNKDILKRVVNEELWPGGGTPLWAALTEAMTALRAETGRRVVLALTDGRNSDALVRLSRPSLDRSALLRWPGDPTFRKVRTRAVEEAFMVYAIGFEGSGLDRAVVDLTAETGGGHFQLPRGADLTVTFSQVAEELRRQYLLGFVPEARDGRMHTLEVRVTRPGYTVRARQTYLAEGRR
jgi:VWFA-related protein